MQGQIERATKWANRGANLTSISAVYRETVKTELGPAEVFVFREGNDGHAFSIDVRYKLGELDLCSKSVRVEVWDVVRLGLEKLREANKAKEEICPDPLT